VRILVVSQYYLPQPLANAEVVGGLARELVARGHDVEVLTTARVAGRVSGVRVHGRLGSFATDRASMPSRLFEYLSFSLGAALIGLFVCRPDVVVALSPPPTLGLVGLVLATLRRRPFVYVVQDLYPEVAVASGAVQPGLALSALGKLMRFVYARSAAVVVIDEGMVGPIEAAVPHAVVRAIPNGIDQEPFLGARRDDEWLRSIGVDPAKPVVMYAGNVGRSQDLTSVALAALACGAQFVIHGGGANLDSLRADAAERGWDHVRFSGFVERARLGTVFASADLHVVPLKPEIAAASVPSKLLSIFSAGRPALVAAEPGSAAARIVREADAGWVVRSGDTEALTQTMAEAVAAPDELARRGEHGRRWAVEHAGSDRCAADYENLLHTLLSPGAGA